MLRFALILAVVLGLYWYGLSGYNVPLILGLGFVSILVVISLCARMRILDAETVPYMSLSKTLSYAMWLGGEIVKANMSVMKTILRPNMEISPTFVKIPLTQNTDIGIAMFANSITLTPGTVSVDVEEGHILVHALLSSMAIPADFKDMGQRSAWAANEVLPSPGKEG